MARSTTTRASYGTLDLLIPSRERSLRATNRAPRTIQAYVEAARLFEAFLWDRGMPTDIGAIRREHVVDHHRRAFCGRNLVIIAVGDFDPKSLGPLLAKTFGEAPEGAAVVPPKDPGPPSRASARLILVDKPDATQTYFQIGQPGIHRTHPDRIPLMLVNTHFGGRFTSMLNDELRVNSGLTYGANCQLQQSRLTGAIVISSYTQTDTTVQAMDLALDVLKRFRDKGLDAEQLASVKAYIKGGFPTRTLETSDQLADVLADLELYGLGRDEIDEF
ncbi:MAG: M16 family metallopeptidase, partial [Acidimicrobiales bacterium]